MTATPKRIQLSRKRGWHMPPNAARVDRQSRWGNPYVVGEINPLTGQEITQELAVDLYRQFVDCWPSTLRAIARRELAGKDLACWCRAELACHASVLLELLAGGIR